MSEGTKTNGPLELASLDVKHGSIMFGKNGTFVMPIDCSVFPMDVGSKTYSVKINLRKNDKMLIVFSEDRKISRVISDDTDIDLNKFCLYLIGKLHFKDNE